MHEERHVANPFEDENGVFHVLVNDEGQHSLWPSFVEVPSGWTIILKSESRTACLEFIERIASMAANEQQAAQASEADGAPAGSVKTIH
jgi:MbtH protein